MYQTQISQNYEKAIIIHSLLNPSLLLCIVGLQLTTLLLMSTVDAQRFYAKLHLVAQLITLDLIEKSHLVQNLQTSTIDIYNKVVSYKISHIIKQCTQFLPITRTADTLDLIQILLCFRLRINILEKMKKEFHKW